MAGGYLEKSNPSFSKKFLFSLATVSVLSTCAEASITGPGCNGGDCATISDSKTGQITITGNNSSNSLTISSGGTLSNENNKAIYAHAKDSETLTITNLKNEGIINGKVNVENQGNFTGTIAVNTFENKGQINGQIYMGIWGSNQGTLTIDNFNNSGTIKADNGNGILFEGNVHMKTFKNSGTIKANKAIELRGGTIENFTNDSSGTIQGNEAGIVINSHINTFTNEGLINSPGKDRYSNGIWISSGANIETFKNSGTISGGNGISTQGGTIQNFINSGTIIGHGDREVSDTDTITATTGLYLKTNTIGTFDNQGNISGNNGITITASKIETFKNSGTIESNSKHKNGAAVLISNLFKKGSTITNFENSGTIKANDASGILIEAGNKIETLTNKGTIEASLYGIGFFTVDNYGDQVEIGKITIETNGVIKAGQNGIHIDGSERGIKGEGIDVKGRLEGGNAGIYIGGGKQVSTSIKVSGTIQGGNGGIINTGTIGQEGQETQQHGITIENNGLITSTNGSGILNTENGIIYGNIINQSNNDLSLKNDSDATITSGIVNSGNGTIHINNQGSIGKNESGNNITNDGNGNIVVEDWVVSTGDDGKLEGIVVGGDKTDNVIIDNVTIDQGGLDLGELEDISNIVSGVKPGQVGNIGINGSGEISLGFDPITGKLSTDFNLNASIAGATFRSLINTTSRRASFIDSVMGNSMQHFAFAKSNTSIAMQEKGNLYANASDYIKNDFNNGSYGYNKEHSLFILPYTSSQNVELSLNEESKGHTRGTIIGYSTLKDSGIYGVYVGYEDTKMSSTYFDINNRSYYTGLKYFNTLFTTSKGQEVYLKAQGKTAFIKNKLSKKIGKSEAEASPNSYAYGMSGDLGMNFNHGDNIFSPEAGLVYEGGYTEAFSMINTKGQATVMGGERTYANYLNLLSTRTSFTWFRDWLPNLKTSMTLGAKFNINPQVKAKARFGQVKVKDEFYLPRVQRYITTSMIVPLNNVFYFSLNYNGMFDSKGDTHTGFAQFNYIW
ncbi:autotransporter outer membrane beta-barrel domain-containing protein [Campylobacter molothri]|uniref:autotransporter outer membrane beta-barrel domain-containing protein n=1 Tax=Campylobacter molothri TaxID=1032242 RepID=UPI001ED0E5D0|nr:autotransporter outer membrane beta-barrel domain-containing protein [Campylobacter sp. RM10535]